MAKKMSVDWKRMLVSVVGVELVGIAGGMITAEAIGNWYAGLVKPDFTPPNWLFGPVWSLLYLMLGVVWYWLWTDKRDQTKRLKSIFGFQLLLNAIWSPVFFGLRSPAVGLVIIGGLWLMILTLIMKVWRIKSAVGWLLVPYLVWVSYAAVLNAAIWWLN